MTFHLCKKAMANQKPYKGQQYIAVRVTKVALLFAVILLPVSAGFAQSIPSGPTAVRKGDAGILGKIPGKDAMPGNFGMSANTTGNLGGAFPTLSCQAEISKIATLTELNRLLQEKISELTKQPGNDKLSVK